MINLNLSSVLDHPTPLSDQYQSMIQYYESKQEMVDATHKVDRVFHVLDQLSAIRNTIQNYGCTESLVYLYGENNVELSVEGLGEKIRSVIEALIKFIVNLKNKIVNFFKNIFSKKKAVKEAADTAVKIKEKVIVKEVPVEKVVKVPVEKIVEVVKTETKEVYVKQTPEVDLSGIDDYYENFVNECIHSVQVASREVSMYKADSGPATEKQKELAKRLSVHVRDVDANPPKYITVPRKVVSMKEATSLLDALNKYIDNPRVIGNTFVNNAIDTQKTYLKNAQRFLERHPDATDKDKLNEDIEGCRVRIKLLTCLAHRQAELIDFASGLSKAVLKAMADACAEAGASVVKESK